MSLVKNDRAELKTFTTHQKQSRRHLIEDVSPGLRLKQEFLSLVEKQYNVRPKAVLGKDIKEVNDWVSQQTGKKVQGFLTSNFPRNSGANAVSAAYFKGRSDFPQAHWPASPLLTPVVFWLSSSNREVGDAIWSEWSDGHLSSC